MNFLFIKHPGTGEPDVMTTLLVITTTVASLKFLMDGVTLHISSHVISFGHMDALSYGSLLAPLLGAHGYIEGKK